MGIAQAHGSAGEAVAVAYLRLSGCEVLEQNTRLADVEVDVLAREGDAAVVVEVKLRARTDYGGPALAVSRIQRERLVRAARWLAHHHAGPVRIDLIAIALSDEGMSVRHYRSAITE
jgi:putative endonuclease